MYPGSPPLILNGSVPGHEKLFNVRRCSMYTGVQFDRFHCNSNNENTNKGKGIRFIILYPPKCSHDLPPLASTVHMETISIPWGIFQSNWQHIAHTL